MTSWFGHAASLCAPPLSSQTNYKHGREREVRQQLPARTECGRTPFFTTSRRTWFGPFPGMADPLSAAPSGSICPVPRHPLWHSSVPKVGKSTHLRIALGPGSRIELGQWIQRRTPRCGYWTGPRRSPSRRGFVPSRGSGRRLDSACGPRRVMGFEGLRRTRTRDMGRRGRRWQSLDGGDRRSITRRFNVLCEVAEEMSVSDGCLGWRGAANRCKLARTIYC